MKTKTIIIALLAVVALTSCQTTYKSQRLHKVYITCPTYH